MALFNKLFLFFIFSFSISSCYKFNNNVETSKTDTIQYVEVENNLIPDTASSLIESEPIDTVQPYDFKSIKEALDFMNKSIHSDKYSEGILPQMAKDCLLYASKLLNSPYQRFIVVDKHRMRVILFDKYGREEKSYRMACAKNYGSKHQKADSRTPEGFFSAQGVYDSTDWLFTDDNGVTSKIKGQFGPRFIRLKTPVTSQIGIHGTCAPWSIGARCSHGCIRIKNEQILELIEYVEVGMPIIVSPSLKDTKVNKAEGYDIPWISTNGKPIYKYVYVDTVTVDTIIATKDSLIVDTNSNISNDSAKSILTDRDSTKTGSGGDSMIKPIDTIKK